MNKNKTFIFKYEPDLSLEKMGEDMLKVVRTGKPSVHLHQISFASIKDITEELVSPRPKLFACLVEKQPKSLYQLAKLLKRDYANVYKDVKSLVAMGVVKLEKEGERIRPIPLYDNIVFDFSAWQEKELPRGKVQIRPLNFLESVRQVIKGKVGIEYKNYDSE